MKKIIFFALLISSTINASAQWQDEGTRYTNTPNVVNHKSFLSPAENGGAYVIWETDSSYYAITEDTGVFDTSVVSVSWFVLQAITDSGKVRSGWPANGIQVIPPNTYAYGTRILTSEDGGVIIAWHANAASPVRSQIYTQKYDSSGVPLWNNGQPVKVSAVSQDVNIFPVIASDTRNGVYVAWTQYDSTGDFFTGNVIMQHINNLGQVDILWNPAGAQVAVLDTPQFYPQIAVAGDNSIYVVYVVGYIGNETLTLNKINAADGSVANGWSDIGVVLSPQTLLYIFPYVGLNIFADNQNNAMVFWMDGREPLDENYAVFMQLTSPQGQTLLAPPLGVHLYSDEIYFDNNAGEYTGVDFMTATQDRQNNNYFVSFSVITPSTDTVGDYNLSLIHLDGSGNVIWQDTLLTQNSISAYSKVCPDGNGGAFVVYDSLASIEYYLNAIGVDSAGKIDSGWTVYGPTFGTASVYDYFGDELEDFDVTLTRKGEAIATWQRFNNEIVGTDTFGSYDIYACNLYGAGETCQHNPAYPDTATAINAINGATETLHVFPNPFSNQTNVNFSSTANYNGLSLEIYNLSGQLVQENKILPFADNSISTVSLASGMYLYQLIGDNAVIRNGKLVKQ